MYMWTRRSPKRCSQDNQHNRKFFKLPLDIVLIRVLVRGVTVRGVRGFGKIGGGYQVATVLVAREIYWFPGGEG